MTAATIEAREGGVTLRVPPPAPRPGAGEKGPGTIEGGLFYNPAMRFSRDLSVLLVEEALSRAAAPASTRARTFRLLDGLAATGARALRLAAECRVPDSIAFEVHANDRDERAVSTLRENVAANGVQDRVFVTREDFARVARTRAWHWVDVDPYGSPAPFMDVAAGALRSGGVLAVTATDTAALTGSVPAPCRRRYDAVPWHGPGMHDAALRILAGAAVRAAARHEIALTPVVAHATDHYVRVVLAARRGAGRADAALARLCWLVEDEEGTRAFVPADTPPPGFARRVAGPMWGDPLQDATWLDAASKRLQDHAQLDAAPIERFLSLAQQEADAALPVYEADEVSRALRGLAPRRDTLLSVLRKAGFRAGRTHTSATAFRTDAPWPVIRALAQREN